MDNILPEVLLDENVEEISGQEEVDNEPPNLERQLEEFREEWAQELSHPKSHGSYDHSKPLTVEERARKLFIQGAQAEQLGEFYVAIEFYKRAIQLVPDIESKIDFRSTRSPRERQDSECSVDSRNDDEDEDNLVEHIHSLQLEENLICQPKYQQNSTHISVLPVEVIMYVLRWVISIELDTRSLEMFSQVCRGFYLCARDEELWKLICRKIWSQKIGKVKKFGSWRKMFIERPHLLFNGCYISKSTYYRPGEKSLDGFYQPFHIVEYCRFIRLFSDGVILMSCSAEGPQVTIPKLKTKWGRSTGLLKGHFKHSGNMVTADLVRTKVTENQSGYYKYKRRPANQNQAELRYYIEFEISSGGRGIHNILSWHKYTITSYYRASNQENVSNMELSQKSFPPMIFSRVKSYTNYSEVPL